MRHWLARILALNLLLTAAINGAAIHGAVTAQMPPVPGRAGRPPLLQRAGGQVRISSSGERTALPDNALAYPALSGTLPDAYSHCSRVAYERWTDNNWEIYLANGDGSAPARLTDNATADESPSIATGCEWIAWAGDRQGNQDIYAMHPDGSSPRRLTTHAARDVLPALSADSRQVAFQSYRDGQNPEVYTVPLEGGPQSRLTTHSAYDGQPSWSPDGQTIAFISARSGTYNIWLMDADGARQRQLTDLPYVGGPRWSPDGTQIAFACDPDGDGFAALWMVNRDGTDAHQVWQPTGIYEDVWPGGWSYDGRYVLYEQATWAYDGDWYVVVSAIDVIDPRQPQDRHRLVEGGINMSPSWAYADQAPPISQVMPLPLTATSPVAISWQGSDECSPALQYQVQYRVGGSTDWLDWQPVPGQTWTRATGGLFAWPEAGVVLYFRSRASDDAGNVEDWPNTAGDTRVGLPARIAGVARDSRGVPVAGAQVSGPAPFSSTPITDVAGRYLLLAATERPATITVSVAGLRSSRLSRPTFEDGQGTDFYLLAEPELVQNGGLEEGQAGWYAMGVVAVEASAAGYGARVARLGGAPMLASTAITTTAGIAAARPALWQTLTIPAGLHAPTLSFMYALGDGTGQPVGQLTAAIQDGADETALLLLQTATPWQEGKQSARYPLWQHAYVDLSPWAGQTVTVMLRYDPQGTYQAALLDEISISPWLLPRIQSVSPRALAPGQSALISVRGENFLEGAQILLGGRPLPTTYSDSTLLSATVPPDLPVGRYDVWVRNPSAGQSALPAALTVGYPLQLPLVRRK